MTVGADVDLGYKINDADNHFTEPPDCFERYIDPGHAELSIRSVTGPDGRPMQLFAGRPSKFHSRQVTFSADELAKMLGDTSKIGTGRGTVPAAEGEAELSVIPGMLLNRLNPLKGLSDEQRQAFISDFRHKSEAFGNRDLRLALMDEQGIDKALMFPAAAHDIEYEFVDNIEALYANIRAFNRWMHTEVGFVADNRMFLPPYIALADPERAVAELEQVIADGATIVQTKSGHAHGGAANPMGGRSPADPVYDRFWAIMNEANIRLAVHLGGTDYQKYGADWSEDPDHRLRGFRRFSVDDVLGGSARAGDHRRAHPPQPVRPLPQHQSLPVRNGHGMAPLRPAQNGPRLHDGPQSQMGRPRPPHRPPLRNLPPPLHRRPLPRRKRATRRSRSRHRTHRLRLRLPPRRRPRLPRPIRRRPTQHLQPHRPKTHHARQPRKLPRPLPHLEAPMESKPPFGSQLVLGAMSMVPIGFRDLVDAAAGAGFDAVSIVGSVYHRGRTRDGLSDADMRALLADRGIVVTDVESAGCWLSPPEEAPERWRPRSSDDEMIRIATALGARGLVATHFGAPAPPEEAAGAFAQLCDRAAAVGVHVSLEFPAMATINDVATAWEIVRLAGRPNGGILVDVWHHRRSTNDDVALSAIPAEKITGLQLADGTAQPVGPLEDDVLLRQLPGDGAFGIVDLLRDFAQAGVTAPVGIEVWSEELLRHGPAVTATRLAEALRRVLASAGVTG